MNAGEPLLVIMGVSGSGKSTVAEALADRLGLPFVDADGLHPLDNVQKMASGVPLTDDDRRPWLARVGRELAAASAGVIIACSALKRDYRDAIRAEAPDVRFVYLEVGRDVLDRRMSARTGHFMPVTLLDSQLATLEPPGVDEGALTVDATAPVGDLVDEIAGWLEIR